MYSEGGKASPGIRGGGGAGGQQAHLFSGRSSGRGDLLFRPPAVVPAPPSNFPPAGKPVEPMPPPKPVVPITPVEPTALVPSPPLVPAVVEEVVVGKGPRAGAAIARDLVVFVKADVGCEGG